MLTDKEAIDIIYSVSSNEFKLNDEQRQLVTDALNHVISCTEKISDIKKELDNEDNVSNGTIVENIKDIVYGMR